MDWTSSSPSNGCRLRNRRLFPWKAVWRARRLGADLLYAWPLQSAALGLLVGIPSMLELHDFPTGRIGPLWLRLFLILPGRKRLLPITDALRQCSAPARRDKRSLPRMEWTSSGMPHSPTPSLPAAFSACLLPPPCSAPVTSTQAAAQICSWGWRQNSRRPVLSGWADARRMWKPGRTALQAWTNVTFTGFVPNERIPLYQSAADVLLMPYQRTVATSSGGNTAEICSPMKMFEYMAAGRAILTSDLPVLHEVLDGTMAVFCPLDNAGTPQVQAWESALGELLSRRKSAESAWSTRPARCGAILLGEAGTTCPGRIL